MKSNYWLKIIVVISFIFGLNACSDNKKTVLPAAELSAELSGVVRDQTSLELLSDVTVMFAGKSSITDADGHYIFSQLEAGSADLTISHTGYQDYSLAVTLSKDEQKELEDILLSASPIEPEGPVAPSITAAVQGNNIILNWDLIADASSYQLYWQKGSSVTQSSATKVTAVDSPYTLSGLVAGEYTLALTASNSSGESQLSSPQTLSIVDQLQVPASPQLTVEATNLQANLSWPAVDGAQTYQLYWANNAFTDIAQAAKITDVSSPYVASNLSANTNYYYALTAQNDAGESVLSEVKLITASNPSQLSTVQGLAVQKNASNELRLTWQAVAGAQSYDLHWSNTMADFNSGQTQVINVTNLSYVHSSLSPATYYYALIAKASQSEFDADISTIVPFDLKDAASLSAPQNVTVAVVNSQVTISWDAVTDAQTYTVYWADQAGVTTSSNKISQATSPTTNNHSLVASYYYRVEASNNDGQSPLSVEVEAVVDTIPQEMDLVKNIIVRSKGAEVSLTWDEVSGADSYQVYMSDSAFSQKVDASVETVSDLLWSQLVGSNGQVFFRVAAISGQHEAPWSQLVAVNVGEQHTKDEWDGIKYNVVLDDSGAARVYDFETHERVRTKDTFSSGAQRRITEDNSKLYTRTGHVLFDSLFALAMQDVQEDSVDIIKDGAFFDASCHCFKTGELWDYVWTRDTAYSVDLALGQIEPLRSVNSLKYKLSTLRNDAQTNDNLEIVQDTGTGGSWPISSDRVTWAIGAWQVLQYLSGGERDDFRDTMYAAIKNTISRDRIAVYDQRDGLYYGEQSFLDWREQTYATWSANNGTAHIGMSKALSTNVAHYQILNIADKLANEVGEISNYGNMAQALKTAINDKFWLADAGMYSSIINTELDSSALYKFDALGEALAIITGVADISKAQSIMSHYPHTKAGVPVIWPQQPGVDVYHNRGIWPFVSAYVMKAARDANNAAVVNHNIDSLMRGAGLNLSNMENFEFITQQSSYKDKKHQDESLWPKVNSKNQLWSVAAYISMVQEVIFGQQATPEGIYFSPYITAYLRNKLFDNQNVIELKNINYQGKMINLSINLPLLEDKNTGVYAIASTELNGVSINNGSAIAADQLENTNALVITLGELQKNQQSMMLVTNPSDQQTSWAPKEPSLQYPLIVGGKISLSFDNNGESATKINIYRNGQKVASGLDGNSSTWIDPNSGDYLLNTYCYAIEQVYQSSGNVSHHSEPQCFWAVNGSETLLEAGSGLDSLDGATANLDHGKQQFGNWGELDQKLQAKFTATASGNYYLQMVYGNAFESIGTGVTATVKMMTVTEDSASEEPQTGIVFMPHLNDWKNWGNSKLVPFTFSAGKSYTVVISDYFNMSYLKHFENYKDEDHDKNEKLRGGKNGAINKANIASLKILRMGSN